MYFIGAPLGLNKDVRARKLGEDGVARKRSTVRDTSFLASDAVSQLTLGLHFSFPFILFREVYEPAVCHFFVYVTQRKRPGAFV